MLRTLVACAAGGAIAVAWWLWPDPPLVDEETERALSAELDRALEENAERRCPRPPLRGSPRPGSATAEMEGILDPEGRFEACYDHAAVHGDAITEALAASAQSRSWARPAAPLGERAAPALTSLREACDGLVAAIRRAVAREEACSPLVPGRSDATFYDHPHMSLYKSAKVAAARARALRRSGDRLEAARLLLDQARFFQDAVRGGTAILAEMIAASSFKIAFAELAAIAGELTADEAAILHPEVKALLSSEPAPAEMFGGEELAMMETMRRNLPSARKWERKEEEDQALAGWLALSLVREVRGDACRPESDYRDCLRARDRAGQRLADGDLGELLDDMEGERARREVRRVLRDLSTASFRRYRLERAQAAAALVALERAVRSRLPSTPCPAPPKTDLLGDELEAERTGDGDVHLLAPSWLLKEGAERLKLLRFSCPRD